jgi:putative oxidoreductase
MDEPVNPHVQYEAGEWLAPLGRLLYAAVFVLGAPGHFQRAGVAHAAAAGVPFAGVFVPIAGLLALFGGLSVLFGFKARWGALMLVVFLVPVTLMMHRFWGVGDAQLAMMQRVQFLKNVGLLGGALMLAYFGAGPISVDALVGTRRRAEARA